MPLSESTASNIVYLRLPPELRSRLQPFHILAWVRKAADDLAVWCIETADPATSEFASSTFAPVAVVAGVCDISALLAATEPLIGESLPFADIRLDSFASDDPSCEWLPTIDELRMERPKAFVYFTQDGTNLRFRGRDGALDTLNDNATIKAVKSPSVSNIPRNLEEKYLEFLRANTIAGAAGQAAPMGMEDGV